MEFCVFSYCTNRRANSHRLQEQCCLFVAEDTVLCLHDIMYAAMKCIFKNRTKMFGDRSYYLVGISNEINV